MCFGVVRPSGEKRQFLEKNPIPKHTHTHTHHKISLFLSVTHSGKLDLHLQPLAHLSLLVGEGIRFPNSFFSHFTFFFSWSALQLRKLEELEEEHLLKGLDDSRGRHDAHVGPAWAGGGKTAQDGNGT